ncbi:MAG: DUF1549 domain-containing protein, partial [Planctomycetales bacterium]|nr:DUF1549 domain-containing protein [Planctomycetales bacterium]
TDINYDRDIRPILSDNCFQCHGPDAATREAGLRLDLAESAQHQLDSGRTAIVPSNLSRSELWTRITADDPDVRMPPASSTKTLTASEQQLIRRWIEIGAPYVSHWSFQSPQRPQLPTHRSSWIRNPIDAFVWQQLNNHRIQPAPPADRIMLLRRLTQDLTGLPPTPEEIEAFLGDNDPEAYEHCVDRLLSSPRYGEHRARYWLDAARYGDTHGLHLDNERSIWPYRTWVVDAFNRDQPFDEFTIEQLAGDLLPHPSVAQKVATGFLRCNVTTSEGGSIDEEYVVRYAMDRTETMSTVWLGLTMGCAACHDHKFDPISQREYYSLYSYFFSLAENAMDGNALLPPPAMRVANVAQQAQREQFEHQRTRLTDTLAQLKRQHLLQLPQFRDDYLSHSTASVAPRDWQLYCAFNEFDEHTT